MPNENSDVINPIVDRVVKEALEKIPPPPLKEKKKTFIEILTSNITVFPTTETKGKDFIDILPKSIKLEMIAIPGRNFRMGSNEYKDEKPIHQVTLKAFHMGKYPITQAQYQAVMGENPSYFSNNPNHPVEQVTWFKAVEFCQKLSQIRGKNYKLPSEAQWEYACRTGRTTKWSFSNDENELGEYAWYGNNSGKSIINIKEIWRTDNDNYFDKIMGNKCQTHQVGQKS
jgi:formylglycine-generating enzyme required for sulfatase activity